MLKITKYLLLLLVMIFSSCEKDDDTNINNKSNPFVGKWSIKQIGEIEKINNKDILVYQDYPTSGNCESDYIVYNENSTYTFFQVVSVSQNSCTTTEIEKGSYEFSGNTLTHRFKELVGGQTVDHHYTFSVVQLSNNTLELSILNDLGKVSFLKLQKTY